MKTKQDSSAEGPDNDSRGALIKAMAEVVGKSLAAYVEVMYPEAMEAASSTFKLSLRNHVYNDIMHVSTLHTEPEIRDWLASKETHLKEWLRMYRKMRREKPPKCDHEWRDIEPPPTKVTAQRCQKCHEEAIIYSSSSNPVL